jgi:hypothetical protein
MTISKLGCFAEIKIQNIMNFADVLRDTRIHQKEMLITSVQGNS